jgi:hypothetical protein
MWFQKPYLFIPAVNRVPDCHHGLVEQDFVTIMPRISCLKFHTRGCIHTWTRTFTLANEARTPRLRRAYARTRARTQTSLKTNETHGACEQLM